MTVKSQPTFRKIPYSTLESELIRVMVKNGFSNDKAKICATIFVGNSLDGIYSHGVNRFAKFIGVVQEGLIKADKEELYQYKN